MHFGLIIVFGRLLLLLLLLLLSVVVYKSLFRVFRVLFNQFRSLVLLLLPSMAIDLSPNPSQSPHQAR